VTLPSQLIGADSHQETVVFRLTITKIPSNQHWRHQAWAWGLSFL